MTPTKVNTPARIALPLRIVSRRDVVETATELLHLRDNIVAHSVEGSTVELEEPSERVKTLMNENNIKKLTAKTAESTAHALQTLADRAPMLRFTFAGEPSAGFMKTLIQWVRTNIHASSLVIYTVQPQIAGGYLLTTDTRRHDASWRTMLDNSPVKLGNILRESRLSEETPQ